MRLSLYARNLSVSEKEMQAGISLPKGDVHDSCRTPLLSDAVCIRKSEPESG